MKPSRGFNHHSDKQKAAVGVYWIHAFAFQWCWIPFRSDRRGEYARGTSKMRPFSTFTALQKTSVTCSTEDFKVKNWYICLSCTHRLTVYYFSRCERLFSCVFLHSRGGRCQPRMVLVMMLPPQRRALTLCLCQLWCVTTAWVADRSPEGEPGVRGETGASLTLSDQQHRLGNQTLRRRDCTPNITEFCV